MKLAIAENKEHFFTFYQKYKSLSSKKLFSQFTSINNFKIKILKNVGHSMMSEAPNDVLDLLIEFF